MKFGNLFEFHKIPEWYHEYIDYNLLATRCKAHRMLTLDQKAVKVTGIFYLTKSLQTVDIPIFEVLKGTVDDTLNISVDLENNISLTFRDKEEMR